MVGTFFHKGSDGFQVSATNKKSEKVTSTVATFLNGNNDGFQVPATKAEPEKVTNGDAQSGWEPF